MTYERNVSKRSAVLDTAIQERRAGSCIFRRVAASAGAALLVGLVLAACASSEESRGTNSAIETNPETQTTEPETSPETAYPEHRVVVTIFWLREGTTAANADITNEVTAWNP